MPLYLLWAARTVCTTCDHFLANLVHAYTRYHEDSETRNRETRPPCRSADNNNEEQTEQQYQPQCNQCQCETKDIRIVMWERIDFAGRSFSQILLIGCLIVLASR